MPAREWREKVPHTNGTLSGALDRRERRRSCLTRRRVPRMEQFPKGAARGQAALGGPRRMRSMGAEPGWGCTISNRTAECVEATASGRTAGSHEKSCEAEIERFPSDPLRC